MSQENETSRDLENVKKLLEYAGEKKDDVKKLITKFTEMGSCGLIWDSKVPEKDKWLFYFFTLKYSDRQSVLNEIEKYLKLYEELADGVNKVNNPERMSEAEKKDPQTITNELFKKLRACVKTAEQGKEVTPSTAVYNLHKAFIDQHEKLEILITGVESAALRKAAQNAADRARQANKRVSELEEKLNNSLTMYDHVCEKFEKLMTAHENLLGDQKNLITENTTIVRGQRALEQKHKEILEEMANLQRMNQEMLKEKENLQIKTDEMERKNQDQLQENQKLRKELEKLLQENANVRAMQYRNPV